MDPLIVLGIGVLVVIGMIIVFRVNAFVALITAAVLVSLLSPGSLAEKISRVAEEFGSTMGKIGIVIALAAVIGKCLMDSGAADRIVRSFLRVLGEKRASVALMGSGFVLAIPVFFDTVFYLLVPLARSLFRRTRKNYLLYVTAIGAGGAITHTLVPPTPGPLFMAYRLNVDVGLMIMVGCLIGLPTALVGLLACKVLNRLMDVPMRPYSGEAEPEQLDDDQLPPLWVSLLPVILPVILISTDTIMNTVADAKHAAQLCQGDVSDWPRFCAALAEETAAEQLPVAYRVMEELPDDVRHQIRQSAESGSFSPQSQQGVREALNGLLTDAELFDVKTLAAAGLFKQAKKARSGELKAFTRAQVERFNRLVLDKTFPGVIRQTGWWKAVQMTAVPGDANLALLISAAIAMFVLVRSRRLSLKQLAVTLEVALMSGGVIILITAGGGAFGAMLRTAGVQDSVKELMGPQRQEAGMIILLMAAAVASVLKFAQGSGTVSMITTASMFAAIGVSSEMLGCHPVYLAAAIGSGSLVGTWMNDSGFWIFARMSGLTELETLKSWTILIGTLGLVGLGFTLLFSRWVPLL